MTTSWFLDSITLMYVQNILENKSVLVKILDFVLLEFVPGLVDGNSSRKHKKDAG